MKLMFISDIHGSFYYANQAIKKFEEENGKIEGSIKPDVNVKPTRK